MNNPMDQEILQSADASGNQFQCLLDHADKMRGPNQNCTVGSIGKRQDMIIDMQVANQSVMFAIEQQQSVSNQQIVNARCIRLRSLGSGSWSGFRPA